MVGDREKDGALALVALGSTVCQAQDTMTVGDLLDRGAKKLTKDEARTLYSNATITGTQGGNFPDTTFKNVFGADGIVKGDAWNKGVWFSKINGKWSVNDKGQVCSDLVNDQGGKIVGCFYVFALSNRYYAGPGDTRDTVTRVRNFSR